MIKYSISIWNNNKFINFSEKNDKYTILISLYVYFTNLNINYYYLNI